MKPLICLLFVWLASTNVSAQGLLRTLEAHVIDKETGDPLPYASIYLRDGRGTITNSEGDFSLPVLSGDVDITVSYVGYSSKTYPIDGVPEVIKLTPAVYQLAEVLIVPIDTKSIIEQIFNKNKKIVLDRKQPVYNFFYRQTTRTNSVYNEIQEAYLSSTAILCLRDLRLVHGRYAKLLSDSNNLYGNFRNFFTFSQASPIDPKRMDKNEKKFIMPLRANYEKYYDVSADVLDNGEGKLIYKLNFTPRAKVEDPILYGTIFVERSTLDILKYEVKTKNNYVLMKETKQDNNDISITVAYKIIEGKSIVESVHASNRIISDFEGKAYEFEINSILFNVGLSSSKKGKKLAVKDGLLDRIRDTKYDPAFWNDNPIVKRTPLEDEVIAMFEKDNLFTNYTE